MPTASTPRPRASGSTATRPCCNTYLATFQTLGGLGLLLGTVGLAAILLRNVLERRGELATLRALGFQRASLAWLVLAENTLLLLVGLAHRRRRGAARGVAPSARRQRGGAVALAGGDDAADRGGRHRSPRSRRCGARWPRRCCRRSRATSY